MLICLLNYNNKLAKDPAFLFYPGDWLGGTMTFSRSHKGAYMDLLMCQYNNGHMALEDIQEVLGSDFEKMWETKLKNKFIQDPSGLFFNEKLENEIIKRKNYTQSRKNNLSHKKEDKAHHMDEHMENENVIENKIEDRKILFKASLNFFETLYPEKMIIDFYDYWTEPNKSGTKFRQELEKTWDIARRLRTWSERSGFNDQEKKSKLEENIEQFNRIP